MNDQIQETDNLLFLSDQTYDFLLADKRHYTDSCWMRNRGYHRTFTQQQPRTPPQHANNHPQSNVLVVQSWWVSLAFTGKTLYKYHPLFKSIPSLLNLLTLMLLCLQQFLATIERQNMALLIQTLQMYLCGECESKRTLFQAGICAPGVKGTGGGGGGGEHIGSIYGLNRKKLLEKFFLNRKSGVVTWWFNGMKWK